MVLVSALSAIFSRSSCRSLAIPRRPICTLTTAMASPPSWMPSPPNMFLMLSRKAMRTMAMNAKETMLPKP